jgi:hypothetical protein
LGSEFFKIKGRFPISFTIWSYNYKEEGNKNNVLVKDLTHLTNADLQKINWNWDIETITKKLKSIIRGASDVQFNNTRGDIRTLLPKLADKSGKLVLQPRYDYSIAKKESEYGKIVSGFPLKDKEKHIDLQRRCGNPTGKYVGFYDDNTPVRLDQDNYGRMSVKCDRIWFRLDNDLKSANKTRMLNGSPDKYGFCAYDIHSAKITFMWFAMTKALNGLYPVWANQFDIWAPNIPKPKEKYFYSLCFAYGLAENRCVVTKFEKDNPVVGAPEVFVDNPLCPINPESFWSTVLNNEIIARPVLALELVELIKQLYKKWNVKYCKGQVLKSVGLQDEAYFKYFDYKDFVTPYSGLIQIKKYTELHNTEDLNTLFEQISTKTKEVREEIYRLLVEEGKYFE